MALPRPCAFWPLTVVAGVNDSIDFAIDFGVMQTAHVPAGTYYQHRWYPGHLTPCLDEVIQDALRTTSGRSDISVAIDPTTGRMSCSCAAYRLGFYPLGPNRLTSFLPEMGYTDNILAAANEPCTAQAQHANAWYSDDPVAGDTGNLEVYSRSQTVSVNGYPKSVHHGRRYVRSVSFQFMAAHRRWKANESAGPTALERMIADGWARFRWWFDASRPDVWNDYALDLDTAKAQAYDRVNPGMPYYAAKLGMIAIGVPKSDPSAADSFPYTFPAALG